MKEADLKHPLAKVSASEEWTGPPAKILVVDDNEDILNVIQRVLAHASYQISTAVNGRAALEAARKDLPDLILLDVMLPEIDGLTVCRELKGDPATRGTMILLVTGRGSIEHRAEGLDAGADDYIPKPFHITELLARVRSSLRIKRLTDELRDRNRQLIDSQRDRLRAEKMATIGLLATGLAHEFNNIMSGISGYAQLARRNPKFRDQLVEVALVQSERALELTKSLSTFYRPSRENRPTQLATVVENALCLVAKQLEEHRIRVQTRMGTVGPVLGSSGQLQEVVLNLVINAIHAIGSDGQIDITLDECEGRQRLSVKDNGCGIPAANLDRIFDPFFTTKGALGGGSTCGSGLGLSVSYNIVRAHAGTIAVKSSPGQGAVFTITLPAFREPPPAELPSPRPSAAAGLSGSSAPNARAAAPAAGVAGEPRQSWGAVLVADSEEAVREMVGQYLGASEVAGAADWKEALALLKAKRFEFAIFDADLPGAPGPLEIHQTVGGCDPQTRLILTSRRFPDGPLQEASDLAWGHLLKPYTIENLAVMMARQPVAAW
jgi:two-component system NtrC family sensor kinase